MPLAGLVAAVALVVPVAAGSPVAAQDGPTTTVAPTTSTTGPAPSGPPTTPSTSTPPTSGPSTTGPGATSSTVPAGPAATVPWDPETPVGDRWSLAPRFAQPQDDTLEQAQALLDAVRAEQSALAARRAGAEADRLRASVSLQLARQRYVAVTERRRRRAVATYAASVGLVEVRVSGNPVRAHLVAQVASVDRADARRQRRALARWRHEQAVVDAAARALAGTEARVRELEAARAVVEAKITGAVDLSVPVAAGPAPVAAAADRALAALARWRAAAGAGSPDAPVALAGLSAALTALADLLDPTLVDPAGAAALARTGAPPVAPVVPSAPVGPRPPLRARSDGTAAPARSAAGPSPVSVAALAASWGQLPPRRLQVLLFALSQVGKEYVWAATGPDAYDCSGLLLRAFALEGTTLVHFSGSQVRSGPPVSPAALAPSDLMAYGERTTHHIVMYVGGGRVVEAKGRDWGVVVSPADVAGAANLAHIVEVPEAPGGPTAPAAAPPR